MEPITQLDALKAVQSGLPAATTAGKTQQVMLFGPDGTPNGKIDVYAKSETYNKTEVDNLITTPNHEYVSVTATAQTTAVTDLLPTTGAADTTYRVGNWDGTQYNDSVYSEYAWNGSAYLKLCTKSQVGEVFDISAYHADTKYSDLAAALGADGANIPQSLRKGGMSIKFVQTFDNKYVQARCMAQNFTTDVTQWQGVDDEPTLNSDNLIKSGSVYTIASYIEGGELSGGEYTADFLCYRGQNVPTRYYGSIRYDISSLPKNTKLRIKSNLSNQNINLYALLYNGSIISYGPITNTDNDVELFYTGEADTLMISVSEFDKNVIAHIYSIGDSVEEQIKNAKHDIELDVQLKTGFIKETTESDIDNNWVKTDYIEVSEGDKFFVNLSVASGVCSLTTYNTQKEKIDFVTTNLFNYEYIVPSDVSYVRFSGKSASFGSYNPFVKTYEWINDYVKEIREQLDEGAEAVSFDNSNGMQSTNVQGAIDELHSVLSDTETVLNRERVDNRCIFRDDFYETSGYHSAVFNVDNYDNILKIEYGSTVNSFLNIWALVKNGSIIAVGPYATSSPLEVEIDMSLYDADELYCSYKGSNADVIKVKSLTKGLISKVEPIKIEKEILAPQKIYSVLNDINANLLKNGYSSAIYLDHFFNGMTEEIDAKFSSSGTDRVVFCPKDKYTAVNTITKNRGNNVNIDIIHDAVIGGVKSSPFTIRHISTLNSVTRTKRAYFMCIGDSVTHGEYANDYGYRDDVSQRYSSVCEQIALIDNIINNGNDYVIKSIGTDKVQRVFTYDGNDYSFINGVVGLSGATTAGIAALFGQDIQMSYYLNKYRNCDDLGVRLVGSRGETVIGSDGNTYTIGTEANLSQDSGNVFKPTHIIIAVGLNDYTLSTWYEGLQGMIAGLKADYAANNWDAPFIGIIIHDTANTIFPSKHPYLSESCVEWGENSDSRHDKQYSFIKYWMEHNPSEDEDTNKVWLLPTFWCLPPGDSVTFRPANLPDINVEYQKESARYQYGSGWCQGTHFNAIGHWNAGYQVYAWIKYTLAKVFE